MIHKVTIGLLAILLALPVVAQDATDTTEETEIRRYTVEVIIFRYNQDVGVGSERFLPDEPEPDPLDDEFVIVDEPSSVPAETPEPLPDTELILLDEQDYELGDVLGRLERLDVYEPVMHFGWTQATWPQEQSEAVPLHRFARPPAGLDGNLTLYLNRFLHLVVDLQLEAPERRVRHRTPAPGYGILPGRQDSGADLATAPVYYRIEEDRILRNGEMRYYDHPKFGVLATVRRVEDDEEKPFEGELLGYPAE